MPEEGDHTTKRAEENQKRLLVAHRLLNELLAEAARPDFNGSVTVEINVQQGLFGRIRKATNSYS